MKIFLITDVHHGENTNYPHHGGADYVNQFGEQFKDFVPLLRAEMEKCDLVVNIGDFIHDENAEKDIETYKEAMSLLASKAQTKHVLGNHDARNIPREVWLSLVGEEKTYYSFDLGGYHHVILDGNSAERRGPIYLSEEQLVWLESDLGQTNLKTIVYCHFPLDNQSMEGNYYFQDKPERGSVNNKFFVRNILQKSGKVLAVFNGHTHFYHQEVIKDIIYTTLPSFSENDSAGHPNAEYLVATIDNDDVKTEVKKVARA